MNMWFLNFRVCRTAHLQLAASETNVVLSTSKQNTDTAHPFLFATALQSVQLATHDSHCRPTYSRVIPRLTKIISSGITFVSRNVISHRLSGVTLLVVSNVNNPVGLVGLPYVMWSAQFFVTHIQTEKTSSWNGPTVHVCCFM
jgi:hypothetical protein